MMMLNAFNDDVSESFKRFVFDCPVIAFHLEVRHKRAVSEVGNLAFGPLWLCGHKG